MQVGSKVFSLKKCFPST